MKISSVHGRQIIDSRGNPTVEVDVILENGSMGRAAVPSGASTGIHEALELRDQDRTKYLGKGVLKVVSHVNDEIAAALVGMDAGDQRGIDEKMIMLDGTENKSRFGANAILGVSLACAKAAAIAENIPLYQYFAKLAGLPHESYTMPVPQINIINGGKHAGWATDLQEFIILPIGADNFSHAIQMSAEIFQTLGKVLSSKGYTTTVGDEGGYAPQVQGNAEPFQLITEAVEKAGYQLGKDIVFGIDGAASEFYSDGKYHLKKEEKILTTEEMISWLTELTKKYPIVSLEDCLDQEDWDGWKKLTYAIGSKIQIIGDDLFVTNPKFLKKGIEQHSANAILIKLNQIGTLTETIDTVLLAKQHNFNSIISHRSGETEDTTIAHLVIGLGTGQIKTGSLSRSDRVAKYNELLRIEEQLGTKATYKGSI